MTQAAIPQSTITKKSLLTRWSESPLLLKLAAGLILFGLWEISVRAFAAPFVTRPSGVIMALPATLQDPELCRRPGPA